MACTTADMTSYLFQVCLMLNLISVGKVSIDTFPRVTSDVDDGCQEIFSFEIKLMEIPFQMPFGFEELLKVSQS